MPCPSVTGSSEASTEKKAMAGLARSIEMPKAMPDAIVGISCGGTHTMVASRECVWVWASYRDPRARLPLQSGAQVISKYERDTQR